MFPVFLKEVLTAQKCALHIIVRGLVRVRCVQEMDRVLHFMTRKGLINTGVLAVKRPLLPERYCSVSVLIFIQMCRNGTHLICLRLKVPLTFYHFCRGMLSSSVPGLQGWLLHGSCKTLAPR